MKVKSGTTAVALVACLVVLAVGLWNGLHDERVSAIPLPSIRDGVGSAPPPTLHARPTTIETKRQAVSGPKADPLIIVVQDDGGEPVSGAIVVLSDLSVQPPHVHRLGATSPTGAVSVSRSTLGHFVRVVVEHDEYARVVRRFWMLGEQVLSLNHGCEVVARAAEPGLLGKQLAYQHNDIPLMAVLESPETSLGRFNGGKIELGNIGELQVGKPNAFVLPSTGRFVFDVNASPDRLCRIRWIIEGERAETATCGRVGTTLFPAEALTLRDDAWQTIIRTPGEYLLAARLGRRLSLASFHYKGVESDLEVRSSWEAGGIVRIRNLPRSDRPRIRVFLLGGAERSLPHVTERLRVEELRPPMGVSSLSPFSYETFPANLEVSVGTVWTSSAEAVVSGVPMGMQLGISLEWGDGLRMGVRSRVVAQSGETRLELPPVPRTQLNLGGSVRIPDDALVRLYQRGSVSLGRRREYAVCKPVSGGVTFFGLVPGMPLRAILAGTGVRGQLDFIARDAQELTIDVEGEDVAHVVRSVRVLGENGKPLPGYTITFVTPGRAGRWARTDESGIASITAAAHLEYTAMVIDRRQLGSVNVPVDGGIPTLQVIQKGRVTLEFVSAGKRRIIVRVGEQRYPRITTLLFVVPSSSELVLDRLPRAVLNVSVVDEDDRELVERVVDLSGARRQAALPVP